MPYLPSRSLRGRLLILVVLVATSLGALAALLIWQAYENERASVFRELGNTARATASLAEQRLENMETLLRGLVAPGELEAGDLDGFRARALRITKPESRWVVVSAPDGRQLLNTAAPPGVPLPRGDIPRENAAAAAAGRAYVSTIFVGPFTRRHVFYVSIGVFVEETLRCYVALAMTPAEFANGTFLEHIPPSHVVSVIDQRGLIVARNHGGEKYIGQPPTPDIADAARLGREAFIPSRTLEGRDVLAAVVPVARSGWAIAVGAPIAALQGSARRLIFTGLFTSLAILAAATLVAWWIARAAIHDVTALVEDTQRVAEGEIPSASRTKLAETSGIAASLRATSVRLREELRERALAEAGLTRAKEELVRANQELEHKVAERTASLTEIVRQMEEFTYSISHDLRGPIRAMTGFSHVILEDHGPALPPDAQDLLRRIIRSGDRMARLINDLLAFSRVTRQEVPLASVHLGSLAHDCVRGHPLLDAHAGHIVIDEPLPWVQAHPALLRQSLANLLENATKFVAPGVEPRVRISAEPRGDFARVWISDNGIGIDPALQPKLFKVFERLHPGLHFEGTGIGLAIVRRAIERMGGCVGVESDGVNGSRFWLELRLAPAGSSAGPALI